jgi:hypothetical protein
VGKSAQAPASIGYFAARVNRFVGGATEVTVKTELTV